MKMRFLFFTIILFSKIANGQTVKLNFVPASGVVGLIYNDLKIYTDSISLFLIYEKNSSSKRQKLKNEYFSNIVREELWKKSSDTAMISKEKLLKGSVFENSSEVEKYFLWLILELVDERNLKIYDSENSCIQILFAKKVGSKEEKLIRLVYFNKLTEKELFSKLIYREN